MPAAELGWPTATTKQLFYNLPLELLIETPLVPHGKILSAPYYRAT
jgi:hypothetical protein